MTSHAALIGAAVMSCIMALSSGFHFIATVQAHQGQQEEGRK